MFLECRKLVKTYVSGDTPLKVLSDVSFSLDRGDSLAILGPSGSGKSTLLNILGTLDTASSGSIMIDGSDVSRLAPQKRYTFRSATVGFVFQLHHLLPQCTALENVMVPALADASPLKGKAARERAVRLLDKVGLSHRYDGMPWQLSGGERQRVALARALINSPGLLLADEPTGSLDAATSDMLTSLLLSVNNEEGTSLVVVTHSQRLANKMQRVMILENGILREASR